MVGASSCREDNPCGALNPSKPNETLSSSTTASATSDPTNQIFTGLAGGDGTNSNTNFAAPAMDAGRSFGFVVLMGGLVAGFAVML